MDYYLPNRRCYCARCRARGYMGPAMVLTVGVLAMLNNFTHFHFHQTWPILLIVVGLVKVLGSSADMSGHVPPFAPGVSPAPMTPPGTVPPQNPPQPPQGVSNV